jgi:hypothetical protein
MSTVFELCNRECAVMASSKDVPSSPPRGDSRARLDPREPGRAQSATAPGKVAPDSPSGRVVHDDRGNAMWDWLKDAGRIAIESTSRLLRKLEIPELKVQDEKDDELRLESDRDAGGGYDPYNQGKRTHGRR